MNLELLPYFKNITESSSLYHYSTIDDNIKDSEKFSIKNKKSIGNNQYYHHLYYQKMPQRSPFAIQELLGLSDTTRNGTNGLSSSPSSSPSSVAAAAAAAAAVSAVTPNLYTAAVGVGQTPSSFTADQHHQMTMAASRMAYFNAHAAVAAAFLPHNITSTGNHHLLHHQAGAGKI